jgi:hypothetical protein
MQLSICLSVYLTSRQLHQLNQRDTQYSLWAGTTDTSEYAHCICKFICHEILVFTVTLPAMRIYGLDCKSIQPGPKVVFC